MATIYNTSASATVWGWSVGSGDVRRIVGMGSRGGNGGGERRSTMIKGLLLLSAFKEMTDVEDFGLLVGEGGGDCS